MPVSCVSFQKHLGLYLDEKLNFSYCIKEKMSKAMKGKGVKKKKKYAPSTFSHYNI